MATIALLWGIDVAATASSVRDALGDVFGAFSPHCPELVRSMRACRRLDPHTLDSLESVLHETAVMTDPRIRVTVATLLRAIVDHASSVVEAHGLRIRHVKGLSLQLRDVRNPGPLVIEDVDLARSVKLDDSSGGMSLGSRVVLDRVRARHVSYRGAYGGTDVTISNTHFAGCHIRGGRNVTLENILCAPLPGMQYAHGIVCD